MLLLHAQPDYMKKAFLLSYGICAVLIAVVLFSCSKDKDEEKEVQVGTPHDKGLYHRERED